MPKSLHPVEHWWIYDAKNKQHIEISPMNDDKPWLYAGVINYEINDEILNSSEVFRVGFFLGGDNYFK